MSRGEILASLGEGRYRVKQLLAVDRIQQEIDRLTDRLAELAIQLPQEQLELLQANEAADDTARSIDLLIGSLQAGQEDARGQITALQATLVRQRSAARQLEIAVSGLISEKLSAEKRRNQLQAVLKSYEFDAWCADYTETLAGQVGLIDVDRKSTRLNSSHVRISY